MWMKAGKWTGRKRASEVPEGQGVVRQVGFTLAHQKGAVVPPRLGTVLLQEVLRHLPAFRHPPVEPRLQVVQLFGVRDLQAQPEAEPEPASLSPSTYARVMCFTQYCLSTTTRNQYRLHCKCQIH